MLKQVASAIQLPQGFRYIPNFVSDCEKQQLLKIVMSNPWCSRLRR
jgi:hypothetical protein